MESVLERTAKSLGVAAAYLLIVSVGYDYAYVRALGLSFAALPTSLADHVRTAILWAPITGVGLVSGFLLGLLTPSANAAPGTRGSEVLIWLWALNVVGALLALMLTAAGFELVVILMATVLVLAARPHARPDSPLVTRFGPTIAVSLVVLPLIILITAYFGHVQGTALFTASQRFSVDAKLESGPLRLSDVGLRRFSSFLVAIERDHTVHVLPESAVQRVQATVEPPQPWRCNVVSYGCAKPSASPPSPSMHRGTAVPGHSASGASTTTAASAASASAPQASSAPQARSSP